MATQIAPLIVVLLCGMSANVEAACNGQMPPLPLPGGSERVSIAVNDPNLGEVERTFELHLPAGYSPSNDFATPLWLDFHGAGVVLGEE